MSKRKPRFVPGKKTSMPAGAVRLIHPLLGIRCWKVGEKHYRSREDYRISQIVHKGVSIDTSIEAMLEARKRQAAEGNG